MTTLTSQNKTIKVEVVRQGKVVSDNTLAALKKRMERKNVRGN